MATPIYSLGEFLQVAKDCIKTIELWRDKHNRSYVRGLKITTVDGLVHFYHRGGVTAQDPHYPMYYIEVDEIE